MAAHWRLFTQLSEASKIRREAEPPSDGSRASPRLSRRPLGRRRAASDARIGDNDTMSTPGRLGIGIIGMGHVGPVIGSALRAVGHQIVAVCASSDASRERADAMLPGVPHRFPRGGGPT